LSILKSSEREDDPGLLFVFDEPGLHGIWMKDMRFPIDILWLDDAFQVVDVRKNVAPDSYPTVFKPTKPARYVLEVTAGFADRYLLERVDDGL
jgi:uncharacterized membrane protein (UPF0127 family)